jgi:hypothetical protein
MFTFLDYQSGQKQLPQHGRAARDSGQFPLPISANAACQICREHDRPNLAGIGGCLLVLGFVAHSFSPVARQAASHASIALFPALRAKT